MPSILIQKFYDVQEAIEAFVPKHRPSIHDLSIARDSCDRAAEVARGDIVHDVLSATQWAINHLICETRSKSLTDLAIKEEVYRRQLEYEDMDGGGFIAAGRAEEMADSILRDRKRLKRLAKPEAEAANCVIIPFKRTIKSVGV